jgi:hypothetical protein
MHAGTRFTHSVKWRLQRLQQKTERTAEMRQEIEAALLKPYRC